MDALALILRLHEHRAWVNRQLREVAAGLDDEQLRRGFPIGQGSLWQSLLHLYAAEYVWLEALLGNKNPLLPGDLPDRLPGNQAAAGAVRSWAELSDNWSRLDDRWRAFLGALNNEDLERPIVKISTSSGAGRAHTTSAADILLHVCTHAQYTTAQAVNMLRHLGVEPLPDVMLITLARRQAVGK